MKSRLRISEDLESRIDAEVKKMILSERSYHTINAIKLCLYVMYCEYGYGEKRLSKLAEQMIYYLGELGNKYDDCWVDKIDSELRKLGIDIKES